MKDRAGGINGLKNGSGKCDGPAGGIDGLKNRSGKCEGPGEGARQVKEPEWEMRRTGRGGQQGKEPEWEMRRTGRGGRQGKKPEWEMRRTVARGGTNGCLKRKVFSLNQKHQPNIVEITHLCIMHGVHTSLSYFACFSTPSQIQTRTSSMREKESTSNILLSIEKE